jgi:hypothetical protein
MDQDQNQDQTQGETQALDEPQSYTGTELDPALDVDFDLDDWDDDENDMMRMVAMGAGAAAAIGVLAMLLRRRNRRKTGLAGVAEQVAESVSTSGKDLQKAVERIDLSKVDVGDLLSELRQRTDDMHLDREMKEALRGARRRARSAVRDTGKAIDNIDTDDLRRRARRVGREARSRIEDVDTGDAQKMMEQFTERVVDAIDGLRKDLAPSARERVSDVADVVDENLPKAREAARSAAENLRDLFGRGRDQGARLMHDRGPGIQKAAGDAGEQANKLADIIKVVALEAVTYLVKEMLPNAKKRGGEVADRVKDDTFPFVRHRAADVAERVREDSVPFMRHRAATVVERVRDDVAPRLRKMAEDTPDRVRDAVDTVVPVVGDATQTAADVARAAVDSSRERVGDMAGGVRDGVSGGVLSVGRRANTVVRETKKTTGYVTKESSGLLFWLAALGSLILLVFIPDKERQAEIWRNIQQLMGELQQMWGDFQGNEFSLDAPDEEYTGDQA